MTLFKMKFDCLTISPMKQLLIIFTLFITAAVFAQPANDDCSNAVVLPLQDYNNVTYTSGNLGNATQSTPACSGSTSTDVWYAFTATTQANKIYLPSQSGLDLAFELYDACGGNAIACVDNNSTSVSENYYDYHFTIGQTYYIKVFLYNQSFTDAPFEIVVIRMAQPNDECANSIDIPVHGDDNPAYVQANLGGATESLAACTGTKATDVWFSFTAASSSANVIVSAESHFNPVIEVFDACGGNSIACVNNNGTNFSETYYGTNFIPGNQYFIRIFGYNQFFEDVNFQVTVTDASLNASPNYTSDNDIKLYPNPASNQLIIEDERASYDAVQLLSVTGMVLFEQDLNNKASIDVSNLKQGVYLVRMFNSRTHRQVVQRVVVE